MITTYSAKYIDGNGEEITTILNDGKTLRMKLRNIDFVGDDFDSFELINGEGNAEIDSFSFFRLSDGSYQLENYELFVDIPLPIVTKGQTRQGTLKVYLDLRNHKENKSKKDNLLLALIYGENQIKSSGAGFFDLEMAALQRQLPQGDYIKSCINCRFSDIGPYMGMFGGLGCYRGNKEAYKTLKQNWTIGSKWALLKIVTESVQETLVHR